MKRVDIIIYVYNESSQVPNVLKNNIHMNIQGTPREVARKVLQDIIDIQEDDRLRYIDCNGDLTNRIGRLIRGNLIDKSGVRIVTMHDKCSYYFNDKGQIQNFIFEFFSPSNDNDLIDKLSNPQNMKALKNIQSGSITLISKKDIIDGYMHDTYNDNGQQCGSYDAGDWCYYQDDFLKEAKTASGYQGDWDNVEIDIINDTTVILCDLENNSDLSEYENKMNDWAKANYYATPAIYFTYWDGSNYRSILLGGDSVPDNCLEYEILEDKESSFYEDLYKKAQIGHFDRGLSKDVVDGYCITVSQWQRHFGIADIDKVDEK